MSCITRPVYIYIIFQTTAPSQSYLHRTFLDGVCQPLGFKSACHFDDLDETWQSSPFTNHWRLAYIQPQTSWLIVKCSQWTSYHRLHWTCATTAILMPWSKLRCLQKPRYPPLISKRRQRTSVLPLILQFQKRALIISPGFIGVMHRPVSNALRSWVLHTPWVLGYHRFVLSCCSSPAQVGGVLCTRASYKIKVQQWVLTCVQCKRSKIKMHIKSQIITITVADARHNWPLQFCDSFN